MKIAVLSGKGGAGKTFAAVNLACAAKSAVYLDCDVEEPNGRLFLKPENIKTEDVSVLVPKAGESCNGCRVCVDFCRFHALAYVKNHLKVFPEVCHSCGGCALLCPQNAITEEKRVIGKIETGFHNSVKVVTGILNLGEASGVPVIKEVLKKSDNDSNVIIDCPPGSACSVMESIQGADYCLLVAEPTVFGAHNFEMVRELAELLKKPIGVLINKYISEDNPVKTLCKKKNISVLARVPYSAHMASLGAQGKIACEEIPEMRELFQNIYEQICRGEYK